MNTTTDKVFLNVYAETNSGGTHQVSLRYDDNGYVILHIEGTPGTWRLESLTEGRLGNHLYIDFGQDWICTNIREILSAAVRAAVKGLGAANLR